MLSALIPDNLETEADFDRAYWRVALPAGGVCMGAVGLVELWHIGPLAFGFGVGAVAFAASRKGLAKRWREFIRPSMRHSMDLAGGVNLSTRQQAPVGVNYKVPKQEAPRAPVHHSALLGVVPHARIFKDAITARDRDAAKIVCPYPEHGEGCTVVYDAPRHQVVHHYDGKVERMDVSERNAKKRSIDSSVRIYNCHPTLHEPRFTVRIVS